MSQGLLPCQEIHTLPAQGPSGPTHWGWERLRVQVNFCPHWTKGWASKDPSSDLRSKKIGELWEDPYQRPTWLQAAHGSPAARPSYLLWSHHIHQSCHHLVAEPQKGFATCLGLHSYRGEKLVGVGGGAQSLSSQSRGRQGGTEQALALPLRSLESSPSSAAHPLGGTGQRPSARLNLGALTGQVGTWARPRLSLQQPELVHGGPAQRHRGTVESFCEHFRAPGQSPWLIAAQVPRLVALHDPPGTPDEGHHPPTPTGLLSASQVASVEMVSEPRSTPSSRATV